MNCLFSMDTSSKRKDQNYFCEGHLARIMAWRKQWSFLRQGQTMNRGLERFIIEAFSWNYFSEYSLIIILH